MSAWGAGQPLASKAGIAHWLAKYSEPRAALSRIRDLSVRNAEYRDGGVITRLDASQMAAIPSVAIWKISRRYEKMPGHQVGCYLSPGHINLSYVGTFMPHSETLMKVLLERVRAVPESSDLRCCVRQVEFYRDKQSTQRHYDLSCSPPC